MFRLHVTFAIAVSGALRLRNDDGLSILFIGKNNRRAFIDTAAAAAAAH